MGDRVNIAIQDGKKRVYFYGHWCGYVAPEIVRRALAKRWRWDDAPYLARIIFCEMVKDDVDGETGYGISADPGDNEHPYLVVDCNAKRVRLEDAGRFKRGGRTAEFSFDEYAILPAAEWGSFFPKT